jgi:DNA-binding NtrC family response regulator/pSer/pThr/pTyr-binding forkhead associated (FHA) protein
MYELLIQGESPRRVRLFAPVVSLGRDSRNDICLGDQSNLISRFHAVLVAAPDGKSYFVRDLSSVQGVGVNGRTVYQHLLKNGDLISIGNQRFLIMESERPTPPQRIVCISRQPGGDPVGPTAIHNVQGSDVDGDRGELLEELLLPNRSPGDIRSFLISLLPAVIQTIRADRGFAGLFDSQGFEEVATVHLNPEDQIEVTTPDFMERMRRGECVRESRILLAPFRSRDEVLGFFCLNRAPQTETFTEKDERFLNRIGRFAVSKLKFGAVSSNILPWPDLMLGKSRAFTDLLTEAEQAVRSAGNILIEGETGSGKEMVAQILHRRSKFRAGELVAQNCAGIPDGLAESLLFGYAPKSGIAGSDPVGAPGLFERANGGTLFLDEIQALTDPMQDRLLRVLQERRVRRLGATNEIRLELMVIGAADRELAPEVAAGRFRMALYRFGRKLRVPSLRERRDDIRLLAHCFLDNIASKSLTNARVISQQALRRLLEYDWPGNIRELQNTIASAATRSGEVLYSWELPPEIQEPKPAKGNGRDDTAVPRKIRSARETEAEHIREVLEATKGNKTKAAEALGLSRQRLLNKMDLYGISRQYGDLKAVTSR